MKYLSRYLIVFGLVSCGNDNLDVGDKTAKVGSALEDFAANWEGYAQAYSFIGDGTDVVRLSIDETGNGTVRFGDEALFTSATDLAEIYPPTYIDSSSPEWPLSTGNQARSGFAYAFSNGEVTDARLRLSFDSAQVMESWCTLQISSEAPCGMYDSSQTVKTDTDFTCSWVQGAGLLEDSCNRMAQCMFCECTTEACHSANGAVIKFDGALSDGGDKLTATLVIGEERVVVVMTRQP